MPNAETVTSNTHYNRMLLVAKTLLFLVAIALSLKAIKEPDLWWQLATGNWILEHKSVPTTDVFSYTYLGSPWINIKWGFEVLIAVWSKFFSVESIYIIQALVSIAFLYFSLKLVYLFNPNNPQKTGINVFIILAGFAYLAAVSGRIIGRPEMFSHLFTVVFVYILNKYKNKKQLFFLLPIIQLVWTNMHEAFGLGIIILAIYTFASWCEYYLFKSNTSKKPFYILLAFLLSILVVPINPYGFSMLGRPFEIFSQLNANKYTTELANYSTHEYWQTSSYVAFCLLIFTLIGLLFIAFENSSYKNKIFVLFDKIGLGNILIIMAFTVLAASAFRNIIFIYIILFPIAVNIGIKLILFVENKIKFRLSNLVLLIFTILIGLTFYISVVSNYFYKINKVSYTYGLQFNGFQNPIGAAHFLKENNLDSQTIFTDYLSSSYLLYQLNPAFKTFIDLRDLDVFPDTFFQKNANAYANYNDFKLLDNAYNFNAVVVLNKQFNRLQTNLYNDSSYGLAYFDPLVSVFVKQYQNNKKPLAISKINNIETSRISKVINYVFNPFYKPIHEPDYQIEAAMFYLSVGNYLEAYKSIKNEVESNENNAELNYIKAQYFLNQAAIDTVFAMFYNDSASTCLTYAIKQEPSYFEAHFSLGVLALNTNNFVAAAKHFETCCSLNNSSLNAHLYVGECYKALVENNKALKYLPNLVYHLEIANEINPNNPNIEWNLGVAYFKQGKCNLSMPLLKKVKDFEGLSIEDKNTAIYCISGCVG